MPYWQGEDEARIWRVVEAILKQLRSDNLTLGGGVVSSGSVAVPAVTVESSSEPDIDGAAVGGDLSGVLPNPTVRALRGVAVGTATPTDGQVLAYDSTDGWAEWTDNTASESGIANLGFTKELLMQDGVTAPPVPIETEAQDDWLYAD